MVVEKREEGLRGVRRICFNPYFAEPFEECRTVEGREGFRRGNFLGGEGPRLHINVKTVNTAVLPGIFLHGLGNNQGVICSTRRFEESTAHLVLAEVHDTDVRVFSKRDGRSGNRSHFLIGRNGFAVDHDEPLRCNGEGAGRKFRKFRRRGETAVDPNDSLFTVGNIKSLGSVENGRYIVSNPSAVVQPGLRECLDCFVLRTAKNNGRVLTDDDLGIELAVRGKVFRRQEGTVFDFLPVLPGRIQEDETFVGKIRHRESPGRLVVADLDRARTRNRVDMEGAGIHIHRGTFLQFHFVRNRAPEIAHGRTAEL